MASGGNTGPLRAPTWAEPPAKPSLTPGTVHLWRASLDVDEGEVVRLNGLLSHDEVERADRFARRSDRNRYVAARGRLRTILARYLGADPSTVRFGYSPRGRPSLSEADGPSSIQFNLSHSRDLALYAVTFGVPVGVDVEYLASDVPIQDVADHVLSAQQSALLRTLAAPEKQRAFFCWWTRAEAYAKARDLDLAACLHELDLADGPGGSKQDSSWVGLSRDGWNIYAVEPAPGLVAALVVDRPVTHIAYWHAGATST
jgi:4'-phosphopantetheinyl transferase